MTKIRKMKFESEFFYFSEEHHAVLISLGVDTRDIHHIVLVVVSQGGFQGF